MKHQLKIFFSFFAIICFSLNVISQEKLDKLLKEYNKNAITYISVEEFSKNKDNFIILDTRELKEFKTSHIKNSRCVGYDNFNIEHISETISNKATPIVVYCSVGIRSNTIGLQLKKAGYTNVKNLYGGIFEWKNHDYIVVDSEEKATEKVHTFSKSWSKWLKKGKKIY